MTVELGTGSNLDAYVPLLAAAFNVTERFRSCIDSSSLIIDSFASAAARAEFAPLPLPTAPTVAAGIACAVALAGYIGVGLYSLCWQRYLGSLEKRFQEKGRLDDALDRLNARFLPSVAIDGYIFKGIPKKTETIKIGFKDLGLKLKDNSRTVLRGCTGAFEACNMVAIMGPSGSGKTTFMNTLCGKASYGIITGDVLINDVKDNLTNYKTVTGFVPQDDIVFPNLTVREQIGYSTRLRNTLANSAYRRLPRSVVSPIVDDVLHILQIGHIQGSIVGGVDKRGISGGQRKRVNIGLELAATPTVLFLDEPTSGLDSTSSLLIIKSLKKMTLMGMTIVMVIHQPRYSLFAEFDQVLLLATGGRAVFHGPATGAVQYFQQRGFVLPDMENPADWMMDVIGGQIKNPADPEFKPDDLTRIWQERVPREAASSTEPLANSGHKESKQVLDVQALASLVDEEWTKLDHDNNGTLDKTELALFLYETSSYMPTNKDMTRLVREIGGEDQAIDKAEFVHFLVHRARQRSGMATLEQASTLFVPTGRGSFLLDSGLRRKVPGFYRQARVLISREAVEYWRRNRERLLTTSMLAFCAVVIGLMHRGQTDLPSNIVIFHLGLALMLGVSVLPTFADKPIFWRESSRGLRTTAFFLAKTVMRLVSVASLTIIYVTIYYWVTWPPVEWTIYIWPALLTASTACGWGYLFSILVPKNNATVALVILMLVLCGVLGDPGFVRNSLQQGGFQEFLVFWSIVRWSGQIFFIHYLDRTGGVHLPEDPDCSGLNVEEEARRMANSWMTEFGRGQFYVDLKDAYVSRSSEGLAAGVLICQTLALGLAAGLTLHCSSPERAPVLSKWPLSVSSGEGTAPCAKAFRPEEPRWPPPVQTRRQAASSLWHNLGGGVPQSAAPGQGRVGRRRLLHCSCLGMPEVAVA